MELAPPPAPTWALLVDPSAAQSIIERLSQLKLPRRICRPLDRRRPLIINPELAHFDAEIDAANDEQITAIETAPTAA